MKFKKLKEKYGAFDLQLFADGGDGGEDDAGGDDQDEEDSDEGGEGDNQDEKRFSQKDMDEAVKKRVARERRKWQREQKKSETGKDKDSGEDKDEDDAADKKARKAEEKAAALEMKWTCLEHDVKKDCVDDVLALAKVHMAKDEDMDIEDAIDAVLKKYPQFKDGYEDSDQESEQEKKGWGQRHKKPPKNQLTVEDEIRTQMFGK